MSAGLELRQQAITALDRRYRGLRLPCAASRCAQLAVALERDGQRSPLLASDGVAPERLVLLDGFKRLELLEARGQEQVLVCIQTLDGPSSLAAVLSANGQHRGPSILEEAWIVRALHEEHGLDQVEIGLRLARHKSWVCRRLQLATTLVAQVQEDVRLGLLSATIARELARLPRGNQARVAKVIAQHALTSRQTTRLIALLLQEHPERHSELLRDPLGHLDAAPRPRRRPTDPRLGEPASQIRQELLRLHGPANRLNELFLDHPATRLAPRELALLAELAGPVVERAELALGHLRSLAASDRERSDAA